MRSADEAAFAAFVADRGDALLRFARLVVSDVGDAEDALQVALLRLARHWSRGIDAPEGYVRTSLVNLARDRGRRKHLVPEPTATGDLRLEPLADLADAVAAQAHLETLLGLLPPRQRLAVVLRVVEGYSEQETARLMRCAPGTVKSSLARGLARLREVLGGRDTVVEACHE